MIHPLRHYKILFAAITCLFSLVAQAQPYTNANLTTYIKTVEFYNTKKESSFPLITLNSDEKLLIAFDDLRGGQRNYHYSVEHCDENWNSSNLSTAEYLNSFNDDQITSYNYSVATRQKYTHYEVSFPNDIIKPKIAGNYILRIYEYGDQDHPILTRRFYILGQKVSITAQVVQSNSSRSTNQKINFVLNYGGLQVQNPNSDLHTVIMQNHRPETAITNIQPAYIRGNDLQYNDVTTNDFPGRNEFRHVDLRSLKLNSDRVSHIYLDTANTVVLLTDASRASLNYLLVYDLDGKFYPGNQDNSSDPKVDADYAHVIFSYAGANEGDLYLVGQFNNYQLNDESKLHYDDAAHRYFTSLFLKQGVYDYEYVRVNNGSMDDLSTEGNHFETENEYQLLVYYRPPSARWTELVGYRTLSTNAQ